jgi:hypothetical protein
MSDSVAIVPDPKGMMQAHEAHEVEEDHAHTGQEVHEGEEEHAATEEDAKQVAYEEEVPYADEAEEQDERVHDEDDGPAAPDQVAFEAEQPAPSPNADAAAAEAVDVDALGFIDNTQPLLWQVFMGPRVGILTPEQYMDAVFKHVQPRVERVQFLHTAMEPYVRTSGKAVLKFWLPVIVALCAASMVGHGVATTGAAMAVGGALWLPIEYFAHRVVFHSLGRVLAQSRLGRTLHFALHGAHHRYPRAGILLLPPWTTALLGVPVFFLLCLVLGWLVLPVYAGLVSAFLAYDFTHSALHSSKAEVHGVARAFGPYATRWLQTLRARHVRHHLKPKHLFGITSDLLDRACGTADGSITGTATAAGNVRDVHV